MLERLEDLRRAYESVQILMTSDYVDMRTAAYELAIGRALRAVELRGF